MDDVLIDIKAIKHLKLKREFLDEIIGYYILYKLGGITGVDSNYEINKIGIYFARHAYLHIINVDDIINEDKMKQLEDIIIKYPEISNECEAIIDAFKFKKPSTSIELYNKPIQRVLEIMKELEQLLVLFNIRSLKTG